MHFVVVGCGRVGSGLAQQLTADGHTVGVIDRRAEAFAKLPDGFTGTTVVGVGFDRERLMAAGIDRADALAAVTSGDNSNILVARVAREAFGVERVAARIYDPHRAAIYERLGIPTIATVQWTTDRVMRRLLPDAAAPVWVDPTAAVSVIERPVPSHWAGRRISDLESTCGGRVISLSRLGSATLAETTQALQDGDVVWVAVPSDAVHSFDEAFTLVPVAGGHH
ncbi:MAG: TrkA family potassium uptake protein [Acidimicrobiales bacterium]